MSRQRPNILFVLTDDQAIWAAGCYGNDEIITPNLDRLAATGTRYDQFFVATPVCSPSRATLLTGRVPSQHGVHDWIRAGNVGDDAARYLEHETCTTDLLSAAGWTCGISGKWHLGASQIPQHGFDHWYVHQRGGGRYYDAPMIRDGELIDEPGYVTYAITDDALQFIDDHAGDEAPFYLSVHYTAPHSPWDCHPADMVALYDDCPFESCPQEERHPWATELTDRCLGNRDMLAGYFAAVTAMDREVGRLLDRLEQHGLREDTLVVFVSDNGFSCGQHGFWGKGNGTSPRNMLENSIRVPLIIGQPGTIAQGVVESSVVSAYDFAPTLLDYVDVECPDTGMVGSSFAGLLRGEIASLDNRAVVIFDEYGDTRMIRTERWKYVHRYLGGPNELWDLVEDPDERDNRIDDPSQQQRIVELRERMEAWFAEHIDPAISGTHWQATGAGQMRPVLPGYDDGSKPFYRA